MNFEKFDKMSRKMLCLIRFANTFFLSEKNRNLVYDMPCICTLRNIEESVSTYTVYKLVVQATFAMICLRSQQVHRIKSSQYTHCKHIDIIFASTKPLNVCSACKYYCWVHKRDDIYGLASRLCRREG